MTARDRFTLDPDGYFSRAGQRVIPVGVNYWPGSCGVEMWQAWPVDEIQHDLDVVKSLGLNCVRFFLRWPDFEPPSGQYDAAMFDRLRQFLTWCRQRELLAQPTIFVGLMSGGEFWPHWKEGRNLFTDPFMLERSVSYARKAALALQPFADTILCIDQGNQLCALPDSASASSEAVGHWCNVINQTVRHVCPDTPIVSGNDHRQITADHGWRLGPHFRGQPGCDLYSMHGPPGGAGAVAVATRQSMVFDGMTDPLAQSLLPFCIKCTRAFGPVMLQAFGAMLTFRSGAAQQQAYLQTMLPACWNAGANGFLWTCLRDVRARAYPYQRGAFEGVLGLVDDNDQVKPGLLPFIEFCRSVRQQPAPAAPTGRGVAGIYWPRHYYRNSRSAYQANVPRELSARMLMANHLIEASSQGRRARIVRGDDPLPPPADVPTLVITGAAVDLDEVEALTAWVRQGGHLIWHGPHPYNFGRDLSVLLGVEPVDYHPACPLVVSLAGEDWHLCDLAGNVCLEVAATTAQVLAKDGHGRPMVFVNRVGDAGGKVTGALPVVEQTIVGLAGRRAERDRWAKWYEFLIADF